MKLTQTHKYDDIIHLSRPRSGRRVEMHRYDRAAQFSPFAALTGFEDAIEETGRLTDQKIELAESGKQLLDERMNAIRQAIDSQPRVTVRWFLYDERKAGGSYVTTTGQVRKIDTYSGKLLLTDGRTVPLAEIFSLEITG